MEKFLVDGERRALREFTLRYYQKECEDFRRYLVRKEKSLVLNLDVRTDIDDYIDEMKHGRQLKVGTINTKLRAIRTLFIFLEDGKYIDNTPKTICKKSPDLI
ncbi:site-specific integrase [Halobacillus litoralis]|nr:site-specific integrase [Halobacillus litoralis]